MFWLLGATVSRASSTVALDPPTFTLPLLVLVGIACAVWVFAGKEEWIIRPGCLLVRKECLGYRWERAVSAVELTVESRGGWQRRRRWWRLKARGLERDVTLAMCSLFGVSGLIELGRYLAARTGWRWQEPSTLSTGLLGLWHW